MHRLKNIAILLPLLAHFAYLYLFHPSYAQDIPVFLGFLALFLFLPSICYGAALLPFRSTLAEKLFLGSPVAVATFVALAYAEAATHIQWLVWLQPFLAVLAGAALTPFALRRAPAQDTATCDPDRSEDAKFLLLTFAVLSIGLAVMVQKVLWVSVDAAGGNPVTHYVDDMGMVGYVFAAARAMADGLPVQQAALAGFPLGYHLFMHYTYAACTQITGIHPVTVELLLFPPVAYFLIAGAVVAGGRVLARFTFLESVLATLLLVFGAGQNFFGSHTIQIFYYCHTYTFGLPAMVLFCAGMSGYLTGRTDRLPVLYLTVCFFAAVGSKANLGILLPLSLLPVLALRFRRGQLTARDILLAASCAAAVLVLKVMLYTNTARAAYDGFPRFSKILTGSFGNLKEMLGVVGVYLAIMVFAADSNLALKAKLKRAQPYLLFLGCFVVLSAVLLKLFNFVGGDQYFFWQARVITIFAFVPFAAHILAWRTRGFVLAVAAVVALSVGFGVPYLLPPKGDKGKPTTAAGNALFADEREGLLWAYRNLNHSQSFFTNRDHYFGNYMGNGIRLDYFDYLAFSGLQGYAWLTTDLVGDMKAAAVERTQNQKAFLQASTAQEAQAALEKIGARYYFHSTRLADVIVPDGLKELHRTPGLVIYENTYRPRQ